MKNTDDFPKLFPSQYAIIIMESTSGIVLNSRLDYADSTDPRYYIFSSLEDAKRFIEVQKQPNTAFLILDSEQIIVEEISLPPAEIEGKRGWFSKFFQKKSNKS